MRPAQSDGLCADELLEVLIDADQRAAGAGELPDAMKQHSKPRKSALMAEMEYLRACGVLENACTHLRSRISFAMPRDEAKAHFDAWHLLLKLRISIYNEWAKLFAPNEKPITQREIDEAIGITR